MNTATIIINVSVLVYSYAAATLIFIVYPNASVLGNTCCDRYLKQALRLNHSSPRPHLLASYGVNNKHYRDRIQSVISADLLALTCVVIYLNIK